MNCSHCGTETSGRFCPNCGYAVAPDVPPAPPPQPPPGFRVTTAVESADARNWAMGAHLSALAGMIVPFGNVIAPLIVWLVKRDQSPLVDREGKEALNFQLSMTIYMLVSALLIFAFIGIPLLVVVCVLDLVLTIVAAIKTSSGESYRYPFTIRFLT
jgi:uncharacterized Tic20 family protein